MTTVAGRSTPLLRTALAILTSAAVTGYLFFRLIDTYAVNVLFFDQWDTYRPLFEERSLWGVFNQQHGPHWLGVGLLYTKLVADLTQWNGRAGGLRWAG